MGLIFYIITAIVFIIMAGAAVLLFLFKRELRSITGQLKQHHSLQPLQISLVDKDVTALAAEINDMITAQKEQTISLMKKEHLLKDNISNISHDLRTPLTSLIGYLQLLQKTQITPEQEDFLTTVLYKSNDLKALVNDFYNISVWEAETNPPALTAIRLDTLITDCVLAAAAQFEQKKITPHISADEDNICILADEILTKRIVDNLITNAIRYGVGGWFDINITKTAMITVTFCNALKEKQEIDVTRIFNKYYTADPARRHSGTGLGLSIVRLLAQKMGGDATAKVERGKLLILVTFVPVEIVPVGT